MFGAAAAVAARMCIVPGTARQLATCSERPSRVRTTKKYAAADGEPYAEAEGTYVQVTESCVPHAAWANPTRARTEPWCRAVITWVAGGAETDVAPFPGGAAS